MQLRHATVLHGKLLLHLKHIRKRSLPQALFDLLRQPGFAVVVVSQRQQLYRQPTGLAVAWCAPVPPRNNVDMPRAETADLGKPNSSAPLACASENESHDDN